MRWSRSAATILFSRSLAWPIPDDLQLFIITAAESLMTSAVSIVIPTWNGFELLKQFLPSVIRAARLFRDSARLPVELLIVDDASTDQTVSWLCAQGFQNVTDAGSADDAVALRLLVNETNLGFGAACNRGFARAANPLVLLLNNDVEADDSCIAPLIEHFEDAAVFAVHCRVSDFDTRRVVGTGKLGSFANGFIKVHRSYLPLADASTEPLYSMFAGGGSAMFDRRKVLDVGGFDELFAPAYWEDVDLSYRAWKRGFIVLYEPRSLAGHRISSTMRKLDQGALKRTQRRNRLMFHWINLHDGRMLVSHLVWVALLAVSAPLRFDFGFLTALGAALGRLSAIRKRRRDEKHAAKRTDRELFAVFESLSRRPDVQVID